MMDKKDRKNIYINCIGGIVAEKERIRLSYVNIIGIYQKMYYLTFLWLWLCMESIHMF